MHFTGSLGSKWLNTYTDVANDVSGTFGKGMDYQQGGILENRGPSIDLLASKCARKERSAGYSWRIFVNHTTRQRILVPLVLIDLIPPKRWDTVFVILSTMDAASEVRHNVWTSKSFDSCASDVAGINSPEHLPALYNIDAANVGRKRPDAARVFKTLDLRIPKLR
ncbi:hypothetical protein BDP27DRAFT_1429862 [Rhodocollybia butyracea]|uniref:Uncharacterized protein n=1 Tax=Rhodocollybia butyracea TaxID=206335 RepID=A0A9P5PCG1_9AGAR|nr:hypothetical protein BDP27DRAFT_1429862 [Rhodocollybia butyracea]